MKRIILGAIFIIFINIKAFALEIVYPKTNPVKINAASTFFIGSTKPDDKLTINGITVPVSKIGAFAQSVPLQYGINKFEIVSKSSNPMLSKLDAVEERIKKHDITSCIDKKVINFVIERQQPVVSTYTPPVLVEYPVMSFYVKNDNAPLRMTPVDSGINRLAHLPKDMRLAVNGEKGDFYRVYLNSKLCGWIAKSDVNQTQGANLAQTISIISSKTSENDDFNIYEYQLDAQTPFVIKEENGLTLQLFNIKGQDDSTLCVNIPIKKLFGYDAYFEDNKFVLKVRKVPQICANKPLKDIVIALDAGHGGKEFGAIGGCGDKEKDINLAITKKLQHELDKRGAKVIMTRDEDVNLSLVDRVKIAKEKNAALLISVHANALPDEADPVKNKGTSVFYYHNQAKTLAQSILDSMTIQLCTQNDKVKQASLALVRPTSSVSVLIEVAYIINPDDYALLLDKNFQEKCAKAIADGIENYLLN